jgi:energy-converting hydrogenase Eha subunit E
MIREPHLRNYNSYIARAAGTSVILTGTTLATIGTIANGKWPAQTDPMVRLRHFP